MSDLSDDKLAFLISEYINEKYSDELHAYILKSERSIIIVYKIYKGHFGLDVDLSLPLGRIVCDGSTVVFGQAEFDIHDPDSIPNIISKAIEIRHQYLP